MLAIGYESRGGDYRDSFGPAKLPPGIGMYNKYCCWSSMMCTISCNIQIIINSPISVGHSDSKEPALILLMRTNVG